MMIKVTSDVWADFVSDYRTYQTEETHGPDDNKMHSFLSGVPQGLIATVTYKTNGTRVYEIDRDAAKLAEDMFPACRVFSARR